MHGRTRTQMFTGQADWDFLSKLQRSINMPIVGNGDIKNEIDAQSALSKTSAIMIGRAIYGKPWLIDHMQHFIKTGEKKSLPPPNIIKDIIHEHLDLIFSYYGAQRGIGISRKHLAWYSKGMERAADFRSHVFSAENPAEIRKYVNIFL